MSTRPATIGAGYLYHCIPKHFNFHQELLELGAKVDFIEYLAAHYSGDPDYLGEINDAQGSLPSSLHSYEYMIGSVERPRPQTVRRLQRLVEISNCKYIGEHVGMVGTTEDYSGTFLQPFGTDEQTQVFIDNIVAARNDFPSCPVIIENQSQVYNQIGPRTVCEQVRDIALEADTGILLSLSNILISDDWHPQDRERELGFIPAERVWEVHVPLANSAETAAKGLKEVLDSEQWAFQTLEHLCRDPDFQPAAIVFEVEASGTEATAEAARTRDLLDWARGLLHGSHAVSEVRAGR
jgi:uncharacterized protein (UPF0276 family)